VAGEGGGGVSRGDDVVDGGGGECEQAGQDRPGQREAQGEQGDRGPVAQSEDGFAPGPGGDPPGAAAPLVQGRFTLGVAGDAELSGQCVPLRGGQPGQGGGGPPGAAGGRRGGGRRARAGPGGAGGGGAGGGGPPAPR